VNVEKVIEQAGGVKNVSNQLGISTQAVYKWQRDRYIPLRKLRAVAELAGIPESRLGTLVP